MKQKTKTLLFVDDEEEILDILVDLFKDEDYKLLTATKAEDARNIMKEHCVDFILSDLQLPDASGSDLLSDIHTNNPETIRVLTSGYLDLKFGNVTENKKDGTLYLSKPWDLFTLKQLVEERLENTI